MRSFSLKMAGLALLLPLSLSSLPVFAQDDPSVIYKGVDANGKFVFSNNPKDMKNPKKMQLSAPALSGSDSYESPAKSQPNVNTPVTKPDVPDQDMLMSAIRALADAKKAKAAGEEPLPGERQGTAGGGTRLTPAYEARQVQLNDQVRDAQRLVDQLQARMQTR